MGLADYSKMPASLEDAAEVQDMQETSTETETKEEPKTEA